MLVDIRVPVGRPVLQTADFVARCEDAGFDGVGVHDHPHSGRDVYVTLAIAAERTRIARLYPATSSPIVRHPLLLASAAHSLTLKFLGSLPEIRALLQTDIDAAFNGDPAALSRRRPLDG